MKKSIIAVLIAGSVLILPGLSLAASHPIGWEDMFAMVRLSDPQPSPDGAAVLFSRTAYDVDKNKGNTDLGLVSIDGKNESRLTFNESVDTNGRWLPDGKAIVFLSNRSGSFQIWKLPVSGGEAEQVTDLPVDLDGFELSPDGNKVLFWNGVFVDCKTLKCTAKRLDQMESSPVKARIYDRLFIRPTV